MISKLPTSPTEKAAAKEKILHYIKAALGTLYRTDKPLVIEEFGLARDDHSFSREASTAQVQVQVQAQVQVQVQAQAQVQVQVQVQKQVQIQVQVQV